MGEDAKTVVNGGMIAGATDVAITGIDDGILNGVTSNPGAGAIGVEVAGVTPWLGAGVDTGTSAGVIGRLVAGVFTKIAGV